MKMKTWYFIRESENTFKSYLSTLSFILFWYWVLIYLDWSSLWAVLICYTSDLSLIFEFLNNGLLEFRVFSFGICNISFIFIVYFRLPAWEKFWDHEGSCQIQKLVQFQMISLRYYQDVYSKSLCYFHVFSIIYFMLVVISFLSDLCSI